MGENNIEIESSVAGYEPPKMKMKRRRMVSVKAAIILAMLVIIITLGVAYKGLFIAATVNGSPVSRLAVVRRLESTSGRGALDSLITEKLIERELDKNNIHAAEEEIDAKIKTVEEQVAAQGTSLKDALASEGITVAEFRKQASIQTRIEKMFQDKTRVSDEEVAKYIADNKVTLPKGQEAETKGQIKEQLKSSKLNQEIRGWVDSIRAGASIKYFVKY